MKTDCTVRPPAVVVPCRHTRCFINHSDPVHPCCGRGRRSRRRGGREAVCWFSRCCRRRSISGQREALHPSHYGCGGARGQTASSRRRSRRLETAASRRDRLGSHTAGASAAPLLGEHRCRLFAIGCGGMPSTCSVRLRSSSPSTAAALSSRSSSIIGDLASSLSTTAAPCSGLPAWQQHTAPVPAK